MAYTTQTLDQPGGGFNVLRFIAGLVVVALVVVAAGAAVMLSPFSNAWLSLTWLSSAIARPS